MRKINVLFMQSQTYYGADSMIHQLLMRYFDRSSVEVHAACNPGSPSDPSAARVVLETIPDLRLRPTRFGPSVNSRSLKAVARDALAGGIPSLVSLAGLAAYIRKNRIDIIHCTEKPRDAFIGLLLARATGAKCVIHLHVKAENWISPLVLWAMRHADALVGVSQFVAGSIIAMGYPAEKTHYVLNSLDLSGWQQPEDPAVIRAEFGIAPHTPLLAIVSRLFSWKGHTELIKALAQVREAVPDVKLLVAGDDDPRAMPGGGSYSSELKRLVQELGLQDNVLFLGYRRDVPRIMAACDIYTMPSFEEPFGVVYLEAMAMKKPLVALDNGGTREIIEHGKSGLLSLPQDIDRLAANIVTLIQDPELRRRLGEHGRQRVEQYFTPHRMAADMLKIYRRLLGLELDDRLLVYQKAATE